MWIVWAVACALALLGQGCCGGAGQYCGNNAECEGALVCCDGSIVAGRTTDPFCANLQTDSNNCGACGKTCPGGTACVNGACGPCRTDADCGSRTCCDGTCVDVTNDPFDCGRCANTCANGGLCCGAVCTAPDDILNCGKCDGVCAPGEVCIGFQCVTPDAGTDATADAVADGSSDGSSDAASDGASPDGASDGAATDAEAGACLVVSQGCSADGGEPCCAGLACPSYTNTCCIQVQQSGCTNSNDCCLAREFAGPAPGGVYCSSKGTCCGMTPTQSGLANAPCESPADCCGGPCTAFGPGPDAGGVPGYCCLPYNVPCTLTNNRSDCCDRVGASGCNTHPGSTGTRCCIPDGVGSHPCNVPGVGDQACCSGHCDTSTTECCTPAGSPCDQTTVCCAGSSCKSGTCG